MGWIFTNEELLADANWLEQDGHKFIIEDRLGRKIYPKEGRQSQDYLQPRASKDYPEKRRKSWVEGLPGVATDPGTGDESDLASERGRKRRLLPAFRAESPRNKKHGWRGRTGSRSDSSDSASRSPHKGPRNTLDTNINTGALSLHLKEVLEREAKANSPAIISPDTPDKWGVGRLDLPDSKSTRSSMDTTAYSIGSMRDDTSFGLKMPPKRRTNNTLLSETGRDTRTSFEEIAVTAPSTPLLSKQMTLGDNDLSPPPSRDGNAVKSKKSRLDIFRSDDKHDLDSEGTNKKHGNRKNTDEAVGGSGLGTAILAAPSAGKSRLPHKKSDSIDSVNTPEQRKDNKDPKEPPSAVTRFFKGVKSEGTKVGEFIFRRDRPTEDSDSDSDTDLTDHMPYKSETDEDTGKKRRTFGRSITAATTGSVASKSAGRYHVDLPSFRSQYDIDHLTDDPVTNQARATAKNRSPRFQRLAPPRMDLRSLSASSTPAQSGPQSPGGNGDDVYRTHTHTGIPDHGQTLKAPAEMQSADPSSRHDSLSRPRPDGRHWSIADGKDNSPYRKPTANAVTPAEIARIRALFLCSGIKAREIARRSEEKRTDPPAFLTQAAKAANAELIIIPRKEEFALAARILVRNLERSNQALHASAEAFRGEQIQALTSKIGSLKSHVDSELFPRVRESGEEALRITSEVSATAPLSVKQVIDSIDTMIRMRRRRMRWVRRIGWMLVEWMLLGIMWWVWLMVVMLRSASRVFRFGWSVVRWLLWI